MSRAFLFDIGNVIIAFDFGIAARKLAAHIEVSADEDEALRRVTELSIPLELGDLTTDEFISEASNMIGYRGTPEFFRDSIADIFELNTPIVQFIESEFEFEFIESKKWCES